MKRTAGILLALLVTPPLVCCSKPQPKPQTPQEVCDAAIAAGIIDKCTQPPANPAARMFAVTYAGKAAYDVIVEAEPTQEALEKSQLAYNTLLTQGSGMGNFKPEEVTFHTAMDRKLLVVVSEVQFGTEAQPKLDQAMRLIGVDP